MISKRDRVIAFFIGCGVFIPVHFIGVLSLAEMLILPAIFAIHQPMSLETKRNFYKVTFCILLAIIGTVISDVACENTFYNFARGCARTVFIFTSFVFFLNLLTRGFAILRPFLTGAFISSLLAVAFIRPESHYAIYILIPCLLMTAVIMNIYLWERSKIIVSLFWFMISFIALTLGSRAMALVAFCTGLNSLIVIFYYKNSTIYMRHVILISASSLIGVLLFFQGYKFCATKGFLGEAALKKYEIQTQKSHSFILESRKEIYGAMEAIQDKPLIGHGSWTRNPHYNIIVFEKRGERIDYNYVYNGTIPTHSVFLGFWVSNGILTLPLCLYFLYSVFRNFIFWMNKKHFLTPVFFFLVFFLLWHFAFSPIDPSIRLFMGLILATTAYCDERRSKKNSCKPIISQAFYKQHRQPFHCHLRS